MTVDQEFIAKKIKGFLGGLLIGLLIAAIVLAGIMAVQHPPHGSLNTFQLNVEYLEGRTIENISVPNIVFESTSFVVKFETNESYVYLIIVGYVDDLVVDEFNYGPTIYNKTVTVLYFSFHKEGFIGVCRIVGPFPDMFHDIEPIGVVHVKPRES